MAQGEAMVSHNPFDLVELGQVCGIQGLIPEHTVDGEVLGWRKGFLGVTGRPGQGMGQKVSMKSPTCPYTAQA